MLSILILIKFINFANSFSNGLMRKQIGIMSTKKRILFIANEMSPYLELTEFAEIVNKLAIKSNDAGFEVRCIMPRFGTVNERRHRLH
ncbi:MAG TPA: glycogen/starch synthase, partial [Segetibacter sp.]